MYTVLQPKCSVPPDQCRGQPVSLKTQEATPQLQKGSTYAAGSNMLKYRNNFSRPSCGPESTPLDANIPPTKPSGMHCGYLRRVETPQANKGKVFQHIHKIANFSTNDVVW